MAEGDEGTQTETTPEAPKTFTQEEVNRIATKEAAKSERAKAEAIAAELGMSVEDAKKAIAAAKKAEDEKKSELDKLREENDSLKTEREREVSEAKKEAHEERLKRRLLKAGLPKSIAEKDEAVDQMASWVKTEVGASAEDIDKAIESFKATFPQLWTEVSTEEPKSGSKNVPSNPSGTPKKPSLGKTPTEQAEALAQERIERRFGKRQPTA